MVWEGLLPQQVQAQGRHLLERVLPQAQRALRLQASPLALLLHSLLYASTRATQEMGLKLVMVQWPTQSAWEEMLGLYIQNR